MSGNLYSELVEAKKQGKKKFAVLIDPDHYKLSQMDDILTLAASSFVDYFFIGGSLIVNDRLDKVIEQIKDKTSIPTILFPGNSLQLSYKADAILFLSLISGRNPELLIGKHVVTAPFLKISPLEVMSTGYMLVDGGSVSSVQYVSNTIPIPRSKNDVAVCTAMAGEMLGLKLIYMDAGSGADHPVSKEMITAVSNTVDIPVIVGGGIRSVEKVKENIDAGADVIVVGNALERDPELIKSMAACIHDYNQAQV